MTFHIFINQRSVLLPRMSRLRPPAHVLTTSSKPAGGEKVKRNKTWHGGQCGSAAGKKKNLRLAFDSGSSRLSCFFSRPSPRLCHCPIPAPGRETASPVHSLLWPSPSIAPRGLFATSSLWNQPSPKVVPKFLARQPGAPTLSPRQPSIPQKWWERGAGRCWLRYGGGQGGSMMSSCGMEGLEGAGLIKP